MNTLGELQNLSSKKTAEKTAADKKSRVSFIANLLQGNNAWSITLRDGIFRRPVIDKAQTVSFTPQSKFDIETAALIREQLRRYPQYPGLASPLYRAMLDDITKTLEGTEALVKLSGASYTDEYKQMVMTHGVNAPVHAYRGLQGLHNDTDSVAYSWIGTNDDTIRNEANDISDEDAYTANAAYGGDDAAFIAELAVRAENANEDDTIAAEINKDALEDASKVEAMEDGFEDDDELDIPDKGTTKGGYEGQSVRWPERRQTEKSELARHAKYQYFTRVGGVKFTDWIPIVTAVCDYNDLVVDKAVLRMVEQTNIIRRFSLYTAKNEYSRDACQFAFDCREAVGIVDRPAVTGFNVTLPMSEMFAIMTWTRAEDEVVTTFGNAIVKGQYTTKKAAELAHEQLLEDDPQFGHSIIAIRHRFYAFGLSHIVLTQVDGLLESGLDDFYAQSPTYKAYMASLDETAITTATRYASSTTASSTISPIMSPAAQEANSQMRCPTIAQLLAIQNYLSTVSPEDGPITMTGQIERGIKRTLATIEPSLDYDVSKPYDSAALSTLVRAFLFRGYNCPLGQYIVSWVKENYRNVLQKLRNKHQHDTFYAFAQSTVKLRARCLDVMKARVEYALSRALANGDGVFVGSTVNILSKVPGDQKPREHEWGPGQKVVLRKAIFIAWVSNGCTVSLRPNAIGKPSHGVKDDAVDLFRELMRNEYPDGYDRNFPDLPTLQSLRPKIGNALTAPEIPKESAYTRLNGELTETTWLRNWITTLTYRVQDHLRPVLTEARQQQPELLDNRVAGIWLSETKWTLPAIVDAEPQTPPDEEPKRETTKRRSARHQNQKKDYADNTNQDREHDAFGGDSDDDFKPSTHLMKKLKRDHFVD